MEEMKTSSFFFPSNHFFCQLVILLQNGGDILLPDSIVFLRLRHHRLHGYLFEAQIRKMEHILGKIQVVVGEGPPDIIFFLMTAVRKFLKFRHDQVVAPFSISERPHPVVDFLPAIQAENHVPHLLIAEIHDLAIQEHAIGGEGEAEFLVMELLLLPAILHQVFYDLPVHQRLSPKEIHLKILPVP